MIQFDIDEIGIFREAKPEDITVGNVVYLVGDDNIMFRKVIEEVLHPDDLWKAFCATDGCRYGLQDLWIIKKRKKR